MHLVMHKAYSQTQLNTEDSLTEMKENKTAQVDKIQPGGTLTQDAPYVCLCILKMPF